MLKGAQTNMRAQEKQDGAIAWVVNAYKESEYKPFGIKKSELAKSSVQGNIKDTQKDLELLRRAASGETSTTFEAVYKKQRGVEFSAQKVEQCEQSAQSMAQVQACTDVVQKLKSELSAYTVGNVSNQVDTRKATNAILRTFKTVGINNINDVKKALAGISEQYKDDPVVKKYGGDFDVVKNKQGGYKIVRKAQNGFHEDAPVESLALIGKELTNRLNRTYADAIGCDIPKGATNKQIEEISQKKYDETQAEYEKSFEQAYGKKDLKDLSQRYMQSQQQGVAYVEMGVNVLAMAGAMFTGGATALISTGVAVTNPVKLIELSTNEDGMTGDDWKNYGSGVLEQAGWMALGMGAGKVGDVARSFVKTKGLMKVAQQSGKSIDEIMLMKGLSKDVAKNLKTITRISDTAGVSAEVATDMATTLVLREDGATGMDWAMSVGSALMGSKMHKQISKMPKEKQAAFLVENFKETGINEADAANIIKHMDKPDMSNAPEGFISSAKEFFTGAKKKAELARLEEVKTNIKKNVDEYEFYSDETKAEILSALNDDNLMVVNKMFSSPDFNKSLIPDIVKATNSDNLPILEKMLKNPEFNSDYISDILKATNSDNANVAEILIGNKDTQMNYASHILKQTSPKNNAIVVEMLDKGYFINDVHDVAAMSKNLDEGVRKDALQSFVSATVDGKQRFEGLGIDDIVIKIKTKDDLKKLQGLIQNQKLTTTNILRGLDGIADNATHVTKPRADYASMTVLGETKIGDLNTLQAVEEFLESNFNSKSYAKNLFELIQANPKRMAKMVDSGLFDMIKNNKVSVGILNNVNSKSFISDRFLSDVKKAHNGEPSVRTFKQDTPHEEILKTLPEGDVATIGDKLYVNDGSGLVELKMTKEKYDELFPLGARFGFSQGKLGDCWFISTLDNNMDLPQSRAALYKLFRQEGDDIFIKFADADKEIKFENSQINKSPNGKNLRGAKGLQMIEQAFAIHRNRDYTDQSFEDIMAITDVDGLMDKMRGGFAYQQNSSLLNGNNSKDIIFHANGLGNKRTVKSLIINSANNPNTLLYFGTQLKPKATESLLNEEYFLYSQHAYTVKHYNAEKESVYISNPWQSNRIVEVPLYDLIKFTRHFNYVKINN